MTQPLPYWLFLDMANKARLANTERVNIDNIQIEFLDPEGIMDFETKDSGARQEYPSGMRRDTQAGKSDPASVIVVGMPYEDQMLTRFGALMARGADKYGRLNYQVAATEEELDRFHQSAFRHFVQWITGETDEDHAAAVWFNILAAEMVKWKLGGANK